MAGYNNPLDLISHLLLPLTANNNSSDICCPFVKQPSNARVTDV